jgi:hypothetical protein
MSETRRARPSPRARLLFRVERKTPTRVCFVSSILSHIQSLVQSRHRVVFSFAVLAIHCSNPDMLYPLSHPFCVPMWGYSHPNAAYMPQPYLCSAPHVPELPSPAACCRDVSSLKAALTTCREEDVLSLLRNAPIQLGSAGYTTLITACGDGDWCAQPHPVCSCNTPLPPAIITFPPAPTHLNTVHHGAHPPCCASAGKRGDLAKARAVFEAVPTPNVWHVSALISAYANAG